MRVIWIGLGGAVGSMVRYAIGLWSATSRFPWATLSVNVVGSFLLGLLLSYALGRWSTTVTTALAVGLLGGFTTFSTFTWESFTMIQAGTAGRAAAYVAASVVGGLVAALLGYATASVLTDRVG